MAIVKDQSASASRVRAENADAADRPLRQTGLGRRAIHDQDYDDAFSGTPEELDAMMAGRTAAPASAPHRRRWSPALALLFVVVVSLALWAGVLLL